MGKTLKIKFKKLSEQAVIPTYAHVGDVGMDLTAISVEYDREHDMYIYHTGLAFESDFNVGQFIFPRSSNRKTDAYLCNSVGIADSAIYRGEILVCFKNRKSTKDVIQDNAIMDFFNNLNRFKTNATDVEYAKRMYDITLHEGETHLEDIAMSLAPYKVGDRVAQIVAAEYKTVELEEVEELSETVRNDQGFGSTGN